MILAFDGEKTFAAYPLRRDRQATPVGVRKPNRPLARYGVLSAGREFVAQHEVGGTGQPGGRWLRG